MSKTAWESMSALTKKELFNKIVEETCPDEFGYTGKFTHVWPEHMRSCCAYDCFECWTETQEEGEGE